MVLFLTHAQPCTTPPHDKTAQKMAGSLRAGLKNWKDSAGIILVSGAFKYARAPTPISKLVSLGQNPLIVPIDELDDAGDREWEVTMVKRSSKTGFFGKKLSYNLCMYGYTCRSIYQFDKLTLFPLSFTSQQLRFPWWPNRPGRQLSRMAETIPPLFQHTRQPLPPHSSTARPLPLRSYSSVRGSARGSNSRRTCVQNMRHSRTL